MSISCMDINAPAQNTTAPAHSITAPAQPPATGVAVYRALFSYSNASKGGKWHGNLKKREQQERFGDNG